MIYLDLKQQQRTLEPNEFTIDASSKEAKAFFTTKSANQKLVINLENKTTYFDEYELDSGGNFYSYYLTDKVNGVYVPDIDAINNKKTKDELQAKVNEAQQYLTSTDHKFNTDYELKEGETEEDIANIKTKRSEARAFIRENNI